VEGPIDKYAIETLSQVLGTQLDALTVIPCYGKTKIAYYQVLCRAYGVPYFTVWDTDSGDDKDNERVELLAPRDLRFAFRSSLEEELGIKNGTHSGARAIREIDRRSEHSDVPDAVRELIRQLARFQDGVLGGRPSRPESLGKSQKV